MGKKQTVFARQRPEGEPPTKRTTTDNLETKLKKIVLWITINSFCNKKRGIAMFNRSTKQKKHLEPSKLLNKERVELLIREASKDCVFLSNPKVILHINIRWRK